MSRYKRLFTEKVFNFNDDIDLITKEVEKIADKIIKGDLTDNEKHWLEAEAVTFNEISTKNLKSEISKKANKINNVPIKIGYYKGTSKYTPKKEIKISLPREFLKYFRYKIENPSLESLISKEDLNYIKSKEYLKHIKLSLVHELSHWARDSFGQLSQPFKKEDNEFEKAKLLKDPNIIAKLDHEFDAMIHTVYFDYLNNLTKYQNISVDDIIKRNPQLNYLYTNIDDKFKKDFKKKVTKRLVREGIL